LTIDVAALQALRQRGTQQNVVETQTGIAESFAEVGRI
jgi:hypothetical protein